ncbi:hypothetical protein [Hallella colorans]|uniref:hypothetical protein n=1 Tax=Hallella colorans TaxID=1703337 RepID=UPI0023F19BC0|nr:hypothetical protein [Hallella colorans]
MIKIAYLGAFTQPVVNTQKLKACLSAIFNSLFSHHENMLRDVAHIKMTGRLPQDRVYEVTREVMQIKKAKKNKTLYFKTSKQIFYEPIS